MIIYKATNKINGKSYIGQTRYDLKKRRTDHLSEGKSDNNFFHNALIKYGKNNFEWIIIEKCNSKKELNEKEVHYIKQYNTFKPNGYNLTFGGNTTLGYIQSEQTKEKISKSMKQKWENRSAIFLENLSKKRSEMMTGKNNPMYGIERLDMMGENNPAKRPEVREKIRKAKQGRRRPDVAERNRNRRKICH